MPEGKLVQREKRILLGADFMDVDIIPAFHTPGGRGRKKKQKETCPAQKNLNDEKSKMYLQRLILKNFNPGDIYLTLTYNRESLPQTEDEIMRSGRNFIRRLKYTCKKRGLPPLRAVMVNGWGVSRRTGEIVRPHHHLIISGGLGVEDVAALWKRPGKIGRSLGWVKYSPLTFDADTGISRLAAYFAGHPTAGVRRWTGTHNLEKPEAAVNDSRYSKRKVARLVGAEPEAAYGAECAGLLNYDKWNRMYLGYRLVGYAPKWCEDMAVWSVGLRFKRVA